MLDVFGLAGLARGEAAVPGEIMDLLAEREAARAERDFARADAARDRILALGFELRDTPEGAAGLPTMSDPERAGLVYGRNPVRELLAAGRRRVYEIRALEGLRREPWLRTEVPVRAAGKDELARLAQTGDHQGVVARADPYPYVDEADLLRSPRAVFCPGRGPGSAQNIGAIARSLEAAGRFGIAIPERGSPGITPVVAKASAGAVEHLEIARVANPVAFVHDAAERGRLIVGADQEAGVDFRELEWPPDPVVVLGAEGRRASPPHPPLARGGGQHPDGRADRIAERLGRRRPARLRDHPPGGVSPRGRGPAFHRSATAIARFWG